MTATALKAQPEVATRSAFTSFIEWGSDHVPQKAMGVFGVGLILIGFVLQSFQYWAALFDWIGA
jgi:hypothetical protein